MTPSRKAALLKLLEDWEAGRMTPFKSTIPPATFDVLWNEGIVTVSKYGHTLTPAGLAEARRVRDGAPHE